MTSSLDERHRKGDQDADGGGQARARPVEHDADEAVPELSFADAQRDASLLEPGASTENGEEPHDGEDKNGADNVTQQHRVHAVREPESGAAESATRREVGTNRATRTQRRPATAEEKALARKRDEEQRAQMQFDKAVQRALSLRSMESALTRERQQSIDWAAKKNGSTDDIDSPTPEELLGRQVRGLWESTRPSPRSERSRQAFMADVEAALRKRWPGCGLRVAPFGSTMTGLFEGSSDVDLCLLDPARPFGVGMPNEQVLPLPEGARYELLHNDRIGGVPGLPDYYNVRSIARALEKFGNERFMGVVPISGAKVPIVKFVHRPSGLSSDLNVNDLFGLQNSKMIKAYCDIVPAIARPLLFAIKKWASRRHINDPSGKSGVTSLNSYTICLLALQFLQVHGIVPNLQSPALLRALGTPSAMLWQKPNLPRSKGKSSRLEDLAAKMTVGDAVEMQNVEGKPADHEASAQEAGNDTVAKNPISKARVFNAAFADLAQKEHRALAEQVSQGGEGWVYIHEAEQRQPNEADAQLGTLFREFFEWMSCLDFNKCGISVRLGHPFRRTPQEDETVAAFPYISAQNASWATEPLLCQDPFISDRNTSGAVKQSTRSIIVEECCRAGRLLSGSVDDDNSAGDPPCGTGVTPLLSKVIEDKEVEKICQQNDMLLHSWTPKKIKAFAMALEQRSTMSGPKGNGAVERPLPKAPARDRVQQSRHPDRRTNNSKGYPLSRGGENGSDIPSARPSRGSTRGRGRGRGQASSRSSWRSQKVESELQTGKADANSP